MMSVKSKVLMAMFAGSLIGTSAMAATAKTYPPRDECLHIDGYFEMRQDFEGIVKRRDAKAFLAMVSPAISWSFGADGGKDGFSKNWKLETGKASPIWKELDRIVRLGCISQGEGTAAMPHMFGQDHGIGEAGGSAALVLGPAVNMRAQPTTASASLRKINWEVVEVIGVSGAPLWSHIKTADGKTGHIRNDYLRGFLDYRIGFERKEKGWVISYFIAGD
jgi:Bacterial SH3 domain